MVIDFSKLTQVTGLLGTKFFMGIVVTIFAVMIGIIWYQGSQKENLRDDIIKLNSQVVAGESSYQICLTQIDKVSDEHNSQLLTMVDKSKLAISEFNRKVAENKLEAYIESTIVIDNTNEIIERLPWAKEMLPDDVQEAINEKVN